MCLSEQACVPIDQVRVAVVITTGIPAMPSLQALRSPSTVTVVSRDFVWPFKEPLRQSRQKVSFRTPFNLTFIGPCIIEIVAVGIWLYSFCRLQPAK